MYKDRFQQSRVLFSVIWANNGDFEETGAECANKGYFVRNSKNKASNNIPAFPTLRTIRRLKVECISKDTNIRLVEQLRGMFVGEFG